MMLYNQADPIPKETIRAPKTFHDELRSFERDAI